MSISRIQIKSGTITGSPLNIVFDSTPTVNNTLVAVVGMTGFATTIPSISSITQTGVTWVKGEDRGLAPNLKLEIWIGRVTSAPSATAAVTHNGSGDVSFVASEWTGVRTFSPVDQISNAAGSSSTPTSGTTATTTQNEELWLSGILNSNPGLPQSAPTNGFTLTAVSSSVNRTAGYEKVVGTTGAAGMSVTLPGANSYIGVIVTLFGAIDPSDVVAVTDETSVNVTTSLASSDPISTADALAIAGDFSVSVADVLSVTEAAATLLAKEINKSASDAISVSDAATKGIDGSKNLADTISVQDNVGTRFSVHHLIPMDIHVGRRPTQGRHPNAVESPSTDFEAAGVRAGWILEILEGVNAGSYSIREANGHILLVQQVLPGNDPGPIRAEVRRPLPKSAQFTAAVVVNQPVFNAGFSVVASMDVSVV